MSRLIILLAATALLVGGCSPYTAPTGGTTVEGNASFEIVSPPEGESVPGPSITLVFEAQDLTIQSPGGANNPNQGHFHIFVDGGTDYAVVNEATYTLTLSPGEHTVRVELRNNDHSPFSPEVVREVTFTVSG